MNTLDFNHRRDYAIAGLGLIAFAILARLLPHPPNFSPVAALAIFGAIYLPKRMFLVIPLTAMFVSDLVIGFYSPFIMVSVYFSFAVTGLLALFARKSRRIESTAAMTLAGSLLFFLITNAAVWLFGTMYTHNVSGLLASYVNALPFFRTSLLGDLFYTGILVLGAEFVILRSKKSVECKRIAV